MMLLAAGVVCHQTNVVISQRSGLGSGRRAGRGAAAGSMVCVCVFRAWERGVYETSRGASLSSPPGPS